MSVSPSYKVYRSKRGADSQSAAPALLPASGGEAKTQVETSLDPAGTSACATGSSVRKLS
jgi:hypothetical protein